MTTVILRGRTPDIADTITPSCPTLALLTLRMSERLPGLQNSPLSVDGATFARAEAEMLTVRQSRGYRTIERAQLAAPNFLLFGVPIVTETEGYG